jgi:hypothetical protein
MTETEDQPRPVRPLVAWLAVLGAALLALGTFCPTVVLPSGEAVTYHDYQTSDSSVVLGAAVAAFVLTWVFRWYRGLFVAAGVALFMIGASWLKVSRSGLGPVTLSWGWLLLLGGAVLLLAAALTAEKDRPQGGEPEPEETPPEV